MLMTTSHVRRCVRFARTTPVGTSSSKDDFQSAVAGQGDGNRAVRLGQGNGGFLPLQSRAQARPVIFRAASVKQISFFIIRIPPRLR